MVEKEPMADTMSEWQRESIKMRIAEAEAAIKEEMERQLWYGTLGGGASANKGIPSMPFDEARNLSAPYTYVAIGNEEQALTYKTLQDAYNQIVSGQRDVITGRPSGRKPKPAPELEIDAPITTRPISFED